jgi:tetratricopeptide (TPR) repeat protein
MSRTLPVRLVVSLVLVLSAVPALAAANAQEGDRDIARLTRAIAYAFYERGNALLAKGRFDSAIADYSAAIGLDPRLPEPYLGRGLAFEEKKTYDKAVADYTKALQTDPRFTHAYNNLGWLLATCPEANVRDGKKAVEYATRACELSDWKDPRRLDTLAAAYAEAGRFEEAVKWQGKAVEWASEKSREDRRRRLELYKSGKPYHRK